MAKEILPCLSLTFSSNSSLRDYKEVIAKTRFEAHEKLLKAVLEDAENQTRAHSIKLSMNRFSPWPLFFEEYIPPL